jgi:hypothetical protein
MNKGGARQKSTSRRESAAYATGKSAGVLISNWNQIVQFLKKIATLQAATT